VGRVEAAQTKLQLRIILRVEIHQVFNDSVLCCKEKPKRNSLQIKKKMPLYVSNLILSQHTKGN
jgi:hypothetical protein